MSQRTVLVADDSQTVQRVVALACAGSDMSVVAAADGDQAIALITEQAPDVVLADITMPGRNGYEVAAFVKGRADLAHIPVLLLAGMFEPVDRGRAHAIGCADVLVKPLTPQDLLTRIQQAIEARDAGTAPAGGTAAVDEYFSRLDEAFKSLSPQARAGRAGEVGAGAVDAPADTTSAPVPTLQELLDRLPKETRERLGPQYAQGRLVDPALEELVDTVTRHVGERLASDPAWLDRLAERLAARAAKP